MKESVSMAYQPTRREFLKVGDVCVSGIGFGCSRSASTGQDQGSGTLSARSPIVDTHMHVWAADSERFPFPHPYDTDFKPPPVAGTLEMLLEEMNLFGIDYAILVQAIYHGWDNRYVAECLKSHPDRFRVQGLIAVPEHSGTHLDDPNHFEAGQASVDEIPLTSLVAPAVVIDIQSACEKDPDYQLSLQDLSSWEGKWGPIPGSAVVFALTGWA